MEETNKGGTKKRKLKLRIVLREKFKKKNQANKA